MEEKFLNTKDFEVWQDGFTREENKYYEGVFAQGNGYFHVRGSFEEGLEEAPQNERYTRTMKSVTTEVQRNPLSKHGVYIPLIMGQHPLLGEVIVNLPFFPEIQIYAGEERLDMIRSNIREFFRKLDMKNGELVRSFIWRTRAGEMIEAEFRRFASLADKRLFVQKVTLASLEGKPELKIISGIDGSVTTNGYDHFTERVTGAWGETVSAEVRTDAGEAVAVLSRSVLRHMRPRISTEKTKDHVQCMYEGTLEERVELVKYSTLGCSRDRCADYRQEAGESLEAAVVCSYEELLRRSSDAWEQRWRQADIQIRGCQKLQDGLRFSMYHLLRCSTKKEGRTQICAKGFAGEAYYGRYFWDSEVYMLPFYIYTDPVSARSMIQYRYHTLEGARENARRYHCRGARYPWHSGLTGTEQCSMWEYADNEVHITADVAFGVLHYVRATGDMEFLYDCGMEILLETACFWTDRVDLGEDGAYHLLNVMGPDEYSPMTRDNGFTNFMVKYSLNATLEMLDLVRQRRPGRCRELMERTGTGEEDLKLFKEIAGSLPVPYDEERGLYLQSADFEEYARINIESIWKDKKRAFGHYASQEKIYRSRCLKQADTIALMSLFPGAFTDAQVETAYEYYTPLTTHDSSLSPAVHALAVNRLGREDEAKDLILRTLAVDMELARRGAEDGIHIANCGAVWQIVMYGFLGMAAGYQSGELSLSPKLPSYIESIDAPVVWKGRKYRIHAEHGKTEIKKEAAKPKAFLLDLDGVITDTAEYHYLAWNRLADEIGLSFNREVNERLKGVSRQRSFQIILEVNHAEGRFSPEEVVELIDKKNTYYKEYIQTIEPDALLPGIRSFLEEAKEQGIRLAVASASKNAAMVLGRLQIMPLFDYIADASKIRHTKPDPEVFLDCMEHLGLMPWECIGIEDAAAGIEAIRAANITAVGIGEGTRGARPDLILSGTEELSVAKMREI